MANHKSAEKRIRSSKRKTGFNKRIKSLLKTGEKLLAAAMEKKDKTAIQSNLNKVFSLIDKAKKSDVLHKNTASRKKSRLSLKASQS